MTLDKAIEKLSESAQGGSTTFDEEFKKAEGLGVEALKAVKHYRLNPHAHQIYRLVGETEE
jgi:hypothetical protein